jgi:hypothetical protein
MAPSTMPVGSSRIATRHQSRKLQFAQRQRPDQISEVACEPELPPELMISGMNSVSTIGLLQLALETTASRSPSAFPTGTARTASRRAS